MDDTELDRRLAAAIAPLPAPLDAHAETLAAEATARPRPTRRPRPLWLIPVIAGGAIVLTAGTTFTAATLAQWPGVGMPEGNLRNSVPIPAGFTWAAGDVREQCQAWIELRNGDAADKAALDAAISAKDWTETEREVEAGASLTDLLHDFAETVFPGIHWMSEGYAADGSDDGRLAVDAVGERCLPVGA